MSDIWSDDSTDIIVLPSGATTGARVVIDGSTQQITIYDASNNIIGTLGPNGLTVSDPDGSQVHIYDENPGDGAIIDMKPADVVGHTVTAGKLYTAADPGGGYPRLLLQSPRLDNSDISYIQIMGGDDTDVNPEHFGYIFERAASGMRYDSHSYRWCDGNGFVQLVAELSAALGLRGADPNGSGTLNYETWHNFPFSNNWAAPAAGITRMRYRKNILNHVEIEGSAVSPNPFNNTVGTIPVGYRPANTQSVFARGNSAPDPLLRITSAGVVEAFGSSTIGVTWFFNGSYSLDA